MTSARFWQISPLPCQQLAALSGPPDDVSIFQTPPPFQSDISTLIETLNVYLIQLKTERCQVNFMWIIILGEYINAVVSRIVIGPLDLKQFLPKFKYFADVSKA